jgi:hypothetical protein
MNFARDRVFAVKNTVDLKGETIFHGTDRL